MCHNFLKSKVTLNYLLVWAIAPNSDIKFTITSNEKYKIPTAEKQGFTCKVRQTLYFAIDIYTFILSNHKNLFIMFVNSRVQIFCFLKMTENINQKHSRKKRLSFQPERGTKSHNITWTHGWKSKYDQHRSATYMPLVICQKCSVIIALWRS